MLHKFLSKKDKSYLKSVNPITLSSEERWEILPLSCFFIKIPGYNNIHQPNNFWQLCERHRLNIMNLFSWHAQAPIKFRVTKTRINPRFIRFWAQSFVLIWKTEAKNSISGKLIWSICRHLVQFLSPSYVQLYIVQNSVTFCMSCWFL